MAGPRHRRRPPSTAPRVPASYPSSTRPPLLPRLARGEGAHDTGLAKPRAQHGGGALVPLGATPCRDELLLQSTDSGARSMDPSCTWPLHHLHLPLLLLQSSDRNGSRGSRSATSGGGRSTAGAERTRGRRSRPRNHGGARPCPLARGAPPRNHDAGARPPSDPVRGWQLVQVLPSSSSPSVSHCKSVRRLSHGELRKLIRASSPKACSLVPLYVLVTNLMTW